MLLTTIINHITVQSLNFRLLSWVFRNKRKRTVVKEKAKASWLPSLVILRPARSWNPLGGGSKPEQNEPPDL